MFKLWKRSKVEAGTAEFHPNKTAKFMAVEVGHPLESRQCTELAVLILKEYEDFRVSVSVGGPDGQVSVNETYEGSWQVSGRVFSRVSEIVSEYVNSTKERRIIFQVPSVSVGERLEKEDIWLCGVKVEGALPIGADSIGIPYILEGSWTEMQRETIHRQSSKIVCGINTGHYPPTKFILLPESPGSVSAAKLLDAMLVRANVMDVKVSPGVKGLGAPAFFGMSPGLEILCKEIHAKLVAAKIPHDVDGVFLGRPSVDTSIRMIKAGYTVSVMKDYDGHELVVLNESKRERMVTIATEVKPPVYGIVFVPSLASRRAWPSLSTFDFHGDPRKEEDQQVKGKRKRIKDLERQVQTLQDLLDKANGKLDLVKGAVN